MAGFGNEIATDPRDSHRQRAGEQDRRSEYGGDCVLNLGREAEETLV